MALSKDTSGGSWGVMRTWLVVIALTLLACLVWVGVPPDEWPAAGTPATSQGPWFEVHVERPLSARPLAGLFGLIPADSLAFNHASRGAAIGVVGDDRLELKAEGWEFFLEVDSKGQLAPGTRLVFPSWLERGGRPVTLRCRPADHDTLRRGVVGAMHIDRMNAGSLRIATPAGADEFSGHFLAELATCENVESGKTLEWPPAPLTVRGSFGRLPHRSG